MRYLLNEDTIFWSSGGRRTPPPLTFFKKKLIKKNILWGYFTELSPWIVKSPKLALSRNIS